MFDNVEKPESSYSFWIFESISSLFFTKWRRNELTAETGMDITNCTFFQQIISSYIVLVSLNFSRELYVHELFECIV